MKIKILNGEGFVFSQESSCIEFEVQSSKIKDSFSLLDICETFGKVELPFGCRSGTCGSCRVEILAGDTLLKSPGAMEQDTLKRCQDSDVIRLSCRAHLDSEKEGVLEIKVASPVSEDVFKDSDDSQH